MAANWNSEWEIIVTATTTFLVEHSAYPKGNNKKKNIDVIGMTLGPGVYTQLEIKKNLLEGGYNKKDEMQIEILSISIMEPDKKAQKKNIRKNKKSKSKRKKNRKK